MKEIGIIILCVMVLFIISIFISYVMVKKRIGLAKNISLDYDSPEEIEKMTELATKILSNNILPIERYNYNVIFSQKEQRISKVIVESDNTIITLYGNGEKNVHNKTFSQIEAIINVTTQIMAFEVLAVAGFTALLLFATNLL